MVDQRPEGLDGVQVIAEDREQFAREYGCTEDEWRHWMPGATGGLRIVPEGPRALSVAIAQGQLRLTWQPLAPRVIALMRLPRLAVEFAFQGVDLEARRQFMRRFDMFLQRGGG